MEKIIINGGDPLKDCPTDWNSAKIWQDAANEKKEEHHEPNWRWDCGFKLDFDGPLISVSSRFYPPKTHYGGTWDGSVTISLMGKEMVKKKFDCATLPQLHKEVEAFVKHYGEIVYSRVVNP